MSQAFAQHHRPRHDGAVGGGGAGVDQALEHARRERRPQPVAHLLGELGVGDAVVGAEDVDHRHGHGLVVLVGEADDLLDFCGDLVGLAAAPEAVDLLRERLLDHRRGPPREHREQRLVGGREQGDGPEVVGGGRPRALGQQDGAEV